MAATKYITTRYGTRINVTGLSSEQIQKVRSVAEDKGAYGQKGATLADTFRKQAASAPAPTSGAANPNQRTFDDDGNVIPNGIEGGNVRTIAGAATPPSTPTGAAPGSQFGSNITPTAQGAEARSIDQNVDTQKTVGKQGAVDLEAGTQNVQALSADAAIKNFGLNNPTSQTDVSGNSRSIQLNDNGTVTIVDKAGKPLTMAQDAFMQAIGNAQKKGSLDLSGEIDKLQKNEIDLSGAPKIDASGAGRQRAEDANYNYITKTYARDKARELEAKKQELAQRGIPISTDPESLWTKSVQQIDEKYRSLDDQAHNQAITTGNQSFATDVGASKTASDAFLQGAGLKHDAGVQDFASITGAKATEHQSGVNDVATLGNTVAQQGPNFTPFQGATFDNSADAFVQLAGLDVQQIMQKTGLDQEKALAMKQLATQVQVAKINKQPSGGGSSGGGAQPPLFAGDAV